jgi:AraC-like DNA-binding protein
MNLWIKKQSGLLEKTYSIDIAPPQGFTQPGLIRLPNDMGQGTIKKIKIRPGLNLFLTDYKLFAPASMGFDSWQGGFNFIYFLSGKITYHNHSFDCKMDLQKGLNRIAFQPSPLGQGIMHPGEPLKVVTITMTRSFFSNLYGQNLNLLPRSFNEAVYKNGVKGAYAINGNTPAIQMALYRLGKLSPNNRNQLLIMEGLLLELIGLQMEQLSPKNHPSRGLSAQEQERILEAGLILAKEMEKPPHLVELARRVGLSGNRLSQGFQEIYGHTPFAYLREMRLNRARRLFLETGMNVTEVAFSVGYNSLSHFSKSFSRQFGIHPCLFRKNQPVR